MERRDDQFVFFFKADSVFSNFHDLTDTPFEYSGVQFSSSEHAFMYAKAECFKDSNIMTELKQSFGTHPAVAKKLGRAVKPYNDKKWRAVRYPVMIDVLKSKFSHPELKQQLLDTGDRILVEASPFDAIWGVKMDMNDPRIRNPKLWRGENLLGCALMEVRQQLK